MLYDKNFSRWEGSLGVFKKMCPQVQHALAMPLVRLTYPQFIFQSIFPLMILLLPHNAGRLPFLSTLWLFLVSSGSGEIAQSWSDLKQLFPPN